MRMKLRKKGLHEYLVMLISPYKKQQTYETKNFDVECGEETWTLPEILILKNRVECECYNL